MITATETDPGDVDGVGRRGHYEWRSRIPYPVRFDVVSTRVERPHLLEGRAGGGFEGIGRWRLFEQGAVTAVLYEWDVAVTQRWMRLLGPIADPVFRWNHDQLMRAGAQGMARSLGAPLLAC